VTLLWSASLPVTVADPKADEQYKVPGSDFVAKVLQGSGFKIQGLTVMGQVQTIEFDNEHRVHRCRVGGRTFRVALELISDKSTSDKGRVFEYEFAISEEDKTDS
jgi:hypothetical protein